MQCNLCIHAYQELWAGVKHWEVPAASIYISIILPYIEFKMRIKNNKKVQTMQILVSLN